MTPALIGAGVTAGGWFLAFSVLIVLALGVTFGGIDTDALSVPAGLLVLAAAGVPLIAGGCAAGIARRAPAPARIRHALAGALLAMVAIALTVFGPGLRRILGEALGIPGPDPSWGFMVADGPDGDALPLLALPVLVCTPFALATSGALLSLRLVPDHPRKTD